MAPTIEDIEEGNHLFSPRAPLLNYIEQRHFANVISAFKHYAQYTVNTLPSRSVQILTHTYSFLQIIAGEKIYTRFRRLIKKFWILWATNKS
jgi:hypothetical protein